VRLGRIDNKRLAKSPLDVRKAHRTAVKPHIHAVVVHALLAKAAHTARPRRRNRNALANAHAVDLAAHGFDHARDLVPQHHGLFDPHRAEAAVLEVMQVGATDAAKSHPDPQLLRAQALGIQRIQAQVKRRMANKSTHDVLLVARSRQLTSQSRRHPAIDI
jgi:hypothetical protein